MSFNIKFESESRKDSELLIEMLKSLGFETTYGGLVSLFTSPRKLFAIDTNNKKFETYPRRKEWANVSADYYGLRDLLSALGESAKSSNSSIKKEVISNRVKGQWINVSGHNSHRGIYEDMLRFGITLAIPKLSRYAFYVNDDLSVTYGALGLSNNQEEYSLISNLIELRDKVSPAFKKVASHAIAVSSESDIADVKSYLATIGRYKMHVPNRWTPGRTFYANVPSNKEAWFTSNKEYNSEYLLFEGKVFPIRLTHISMRDRLMSPDLFKFIRSRFSTNKAARNLVMLSSFAYTHSEYDRNLDIAIGVETPMMAFTPKAKVADDRGNGTWVGNVRQEGKIGKVIKKMLDKHPDIDYDYDMSYTNQDLEKLVNEIKAEFTLSADMLLVEGKEITKWYHYNMHASTNIGSLGSSCMKHDSCQTYFGIYEDNAKMAVLINKNKRVIGRGLLWNANMDGKEITFLDRIYGADYIMSVFKSWAKANGHHSKWKQGHSSITDIETPEGKHVVAKKLEVPIKGGNDHKQFPYFDTFKYMNGDGTLLSISSKDSKWALSRTGGIRDRLN